jgi:hypothetical protein
MYEEIEVEPATYVRRSHYRRKQELYPTLRHSPYRALGEFGRKKRLVENIWSKIIGRNRLVENIWSKNNWSKIIGRILNNYKIL